MTTAKFGIRVTTPGDVHHDCIGEVNLDVRGTFQAWQFGNLRIRMGKVPGGVRILMTNTGRPPYVAGAWTGGDPFRFTGVALGAPGDDWVPAWAEKKQATPAGFLHEGMSIWVGVGPQTTRSVVGPNRRPPEPEGVFVLEGGQSLTWLFYDDVNVSDLNDYYRDTIQSKFIGNDTSLPPRLQRFVRHSANAFPLLGMRGAFCYLEQYHDRFGYGRLPALRGPFLWGCLPWAEGLTCHYGLDYELLMAALRSQISIGLPLLIAEAKVTQGFALCAHPEGTFSNSTHAMESYEKSGGASAIGWPNRATNSFPQWTHNWYRGIFAVNALLKGEDFLFDEAAKLAVGEAGFCHAASRAK